MLVLDYAPAILAFVFAVLGIIAKTKDDSKIGVRRITWAGYMFLALSAAALALGAYTIRAQHITLGKRAIVADIARERLIEGLALVVTPFCSNERAFSAKGVDEIFKILGSQANLETVGREKAVKWRDETGVAISPFYQRLDEPYQVLDRYISSGRIILEGTLASYGSYLSEDEIIALSVLLSDPFLNGDYILSERSDFFYEGRSDEARTGEDSPWNTIGLHYFNAIYDGDSARSGNVQPALIFLSKSEDAVLSIFHKLPSGDGFAPCRR